MRLKIFKHLRKNVSECIHKQKPTLTTYVMRKTIPFKSRTESWMYIENSLSIMQMKSRDVSVGQQLSLYNSLYSIQGHLYRLIALFRKLKFSCAFLFLCCTAGQSDRLSVRPSAIFLRYLPCASINCHQTFVNGASWEKDETFRFSGQLGSKGQRLRSQQAVRRVITVLVRLRNVFVNTFVNVQADPYIQVRLGPTKIDTADDYVPNTLNPVFGK